MRQTLRTGLMRLPELAFFSFALLMNACLAIYFACRDCIALVAQANHIAHFTTLVAVVVFAPAVVLRARWWILAWLAPGAIMFFVWYGRQFLPKSESDVAGTEFTVATYNVWGFAADPDETFAVVQAMDADIIGFEELRPILQGRLESELSERYPYQTSKVIQGFDGLALISRFAIVESHIELDIDFDNVDLAPVRYLRAVVEIDGQPVVVYVFHPPIAIFKTLRSYDDTYNRESYEQLAKLIDAETDPTLLLCDCNFTPRTSQYTWINDVLDDSFFESGWGFGLTYPARHTTPGVPIPIVRLDYIWHSDAFTALEAKVWKQNGTSDHHPMWARLAMHSPE